MKEKCLNNKIDLQAIKSSCKNDTIAMIKVFVSYCHSKKEGGNILSPFFYRSPSNICRFRNKEYRVVDLVKWFLVEYVDDLIGSDKKCWYGRD